MLGFNIPIYDIQEVKELIPKGYYVSNISIQQERGPMLCFTVEEMVK